MRLCCLACPISLVPRAFVAALAPAFALYRAQLPVRSPSRPSWRPSCSAQSRLPSLAWVCREAGARVTTNTLVRDLDAPVDRLDDRRIEFIADGLPPRNSDLARPVALLDARRQKERAYPELVRSSRCRLVVLGVEVGGRWSTETAAACPPTSCAGPQPEMPLRPCVLPTRPPWSTAGLAS